MVLCRCLPTSADRYAQPPAVPTAMKILHGPICPEFAIVEHIAVHPATLRLLVSNFFLARPAHFRHRLVCSSVEMREGAKIMYIAVYSRPL